MVNDQIRSLDLLRKRILFEGATFQHPTEVLRSDVLDAVFTSELLDATYPHRAKTLRILDSIIKNLTEEVER